MSQRRTMLPEVLPAPSSGVRGTARERAVARLRRLVELSAAGGALGLNACGSGYGVVDPLPPPATCEDPYSYGGSWFTGPSASWANDGTEVVIFFQLDAWGVQITFADVTTDTGTVTGLDDPNGPAILVRLTPDPAATRATIEVTVHCRGEEGGSRDLTQRIELDLSGDRTDGAAVPTYF